MRFRETLVAAIGLAAAVLLPAAVSAQALEEITVTAQKREQSLQDVAVSVTAITGEQLSDLGVFSLEAMQDHVPNLTINNQYGTIPIFNIRGVAFSDWAPNTVSPVTPYVDEIGIPYSVVTTGLIYDLEAVETLRGPQGTLFGRNTTGGAVLIRTANPTEQFSGGMTLEAGEFDRLYFEGFLSGPVTDSIGVRLSVATTQQGEGWIDGVDYTPNGSTFDVTPNGQKLGEIDQTALRLVSTYEGDIFSARLNVNWQSDKSDMIMGNVFQEFPDVFGTTYPVSPYRTSSWNFDESNFFPEFRQAVPDKPSVDNSGTGAALRLNWDFDAFSLTSVTGYNEFDREAFSDWDGTPGHDMDNADFNDIEFWSQEIRLSSNADGPLTWLIGAYIAEDEMKTRWHNDLSTTPAFPAAVDVLYTQRGETSAIFGQVEWAFSDAMSLTLGLRRNDDTKKFIDAATLLTGDPLLLFFDFVNCDPANPADIDDPACHPVRGLNLTTLFSGGDPTASTSASASWENTSGNIGLNWNISDDVLLYATASRGYKAGGYYGTATAVESLYQTAYNPETVWAYEGGFKSTLSDGALRINGALFLYDYEDRQFAGTRSDPVFGGLGQTLNQEEVELYGGELEIEWQVTDNFYLRQGIGYKSGEIKRGSPVNVDFVCVNDFIATWNADPANAGNQIPDGINEQWLSSCQDLQIGQEIGFPNWTLNGLAEYRFPVGRMGGRVAVDYRYEGEATSVNNPEFTIDSFTIVNARVGLIGADENWDLSLWVRNLGDEKYANSRDIFNQAFVQFPGAPRTIGIRLGYRF